MKDPLYLIDSYATIYRSYFAFMARPLKNGAGENISALFGFCRLVAALLEEGGEPRLVAAVFDSRGPTFRKQRYPAYKATRQKAPQDLHSQVPKIEAFLEALGMAALRVEGYEADDIIATLASACKAEGRECYIISSDKDLLQLVGGGVYELRPAKNKAAGEGGLPAFRSPLANYERIGPDEVKAQWGVPPEKMLDFLSLCGDASDNVPGVKGIGDKTALKLMQRYGSLDEIYRNIAAIEGSVGKKLAQSRETAYLSRDLIALVRDVPLKIGSADAFSLEKLNRAAAAEALFREEMPSIAKLIDGGKDAPAAPAPPAAEAEAGEGPPVERERAHIGIPPVAEESLLGQGVYRVISDEAELKAFFQKAAEQGWFSLDFETDSLDAWHATPVGISLALKPKEAFYVPLVYARSTGEDEDKKSSLPSAVVRPLLAALLADPRITVVAHNAKYDYEVSRAWGLPRWKARVWDTMVAAWLLDSERVGYSLDSLAASFLKYAALSYHDVVPRGGSFACVPVETACRYSAEDADLCLRLKLHFEPLLVQAGAASLFNDIEMPLLPILAEMEGVGIQIEGGRLKTYGVELGVELDAIQAETWRVVGHEFNLGSPKQMQEVLFVERKLKPTKKIKTGWSTNVAVLEELARDDRVPELILRHRALAKLKSTYVDSLACMAGADGRLHTSFVQTGTTTGRLSSRDPNLQNIPIREEAGRRIREAFVAGPGKLLVSADYSQIELVVLAHLSGDENLIAAFQSGSDVHTRTAALIFGIDEARVDPMQRRMAKIINFGVMYGMSPFRLSGRLKIGRTAAADFIKTYFETYAGVKRHIDSLIASAEKTGYAATIFGRRRAIPTINSANKMEKAAACRVAVNTPIQGSAADIVKKAMIDLDKALEGEEGEGPRQPGGPKLGNAAHGLKADCAGLSAVGRNKKSAAGRNKKNHLLLQVHDELILECPEESAEETVKLVRAVMENAVKLTVPLRVNVECGKRWGDFH
ncbi:MAG: DNA polymerase I [Spirochaetaceae bacterium]|jgi:DNA polymerase-1|nr:DNA polymerase I [Spirochaetaceae bacterium]